MPLFLHSRHNRQELLPFLCVLISSLLGRSQTALQLCWATRGTLAGGLEFGWKSWYAGKALYLGVSRCGRDDGENQVRAKVAKQALKGSTARAGGQARQGPGPGLVVRGTGTRGIGGDGAAVVFRVCLWAPGPSPMFLLPFPGTWICAQSLFIPGVSCLFCAVPGGPRPSFPTYHPHPNSRCSLQSLLPALVICSLYCPDLPRPGSLD